MKKCTTCNKYKDISDFSIGRSICKKCKNKYANNRNILIGRTKNLDGSKKKHVPKYNLVGKQFGNLLVMEFVGMKELKNKKRLSFFNCKCKCGNYKIVAGAYLKYGKVKSCGCFSHKKRENSKNWTGYKGISGSSWNKIERNSFKSKREKRKKLLFDIDKKYVWNLFVKQNGKCNLTGLDILLDVGGKTKNQTASLDRIDSSKGYIKGNVQWIHKDVNSMKMDYDEKYFVEICSLIANKRK